MLLAILINTITLVFYDYSWRLESSEKPKSEDSFSSISNYIFGAIFVFEFLVKVTAMGFAFEKHTFLRDPWNILDLVVVIDR